MCKYDPILNIFAAAERKSPGPPRRGVQWRRDERRRAKSRQTPPAEGKSSGGKPKEVHRASGLYTPRCRSGGGPVISCDACIKSITPCFSRNARDTTSHRFSTDC